MKNDINMNRRALTAGVWYTFSNFLVRGIGFLTTPIFTRILSQADYGNYVNYTSWLSLLTILTTFEMYVSINRARFDYKENLNEYLSSIALCGTAITAICYLVVIIFSNFFVSLFGMDMIYIHIMFIYLLVEPALPLLSTQYRLRMQYKMVTVLSLSSTILSVVISLVLVSVMKNQLLGRVIGNTVTLFCLNLVLYIFILIKGKKFKFSYCRYGLSIAVPMLPHLLANNILGSTDRIMIKRFCGAEETALYGVIYSCSLVITILMNSVNQAWSPWFYENINKSNYDIVKKVSKIYVTVLCWIFILIMLCSPEFVFIFAGKSYMEAVDLMPPIMLGCIMQFFYTLYVNVEIYNKRTFGISIRTLTAALVNLILNFIFIPLFGYKAAAYTTLIGYLILFALHYFATKKLNTSDYFDNKYIWMLALAIMICAGVVLISYHYVIMRYILIIINVLIMGMIVLKNKNRIKALIHKK